MILDRDTKIAKITKFLSKLLNALETLDESIQCTQELSCIKFRI